MIVVLGIMVLVHETGHFITAKLCGVRVEVFSIGMGNRLFGFKRGERDYRISLLPLGGYVKMAGEYSGDSGVVERGSGNPGDFTSRPRWQRILIGLSGPVSNFLLAFALMTGLYMMHNEVDAYLNGPAMIDYVPANTAAAAAGLQAGDRIVQFGKEHNPDWQQVGIRMGIDSKETVPVTVARPSGEVTVQLPLAAGMSADGPDPLALGLEPRWQAAPLTIREVEPEQKRSISPSLRLRVMTAQAARAGALASDHRRLRLRWSRSRSGRLPHGLFTTTCKAPARSPR